MKQSVIKFDSDGELRISASNFMCMGLGEISRDFEQKGHFDIDLSLHYQKINSRF